jgi:hypothetical protein
MLLLLLTFLFSKMIQCKAAKNEKDESRNNMKVKEFSMHIAKGHQNTDHGLYLVLAFLCIILLKAQEKKQVLCIILLKALNKKQLILHHLSIYLQGPSLIASETN